MRLEDVTAEIRPRAPWESIDLGCALARRHLGSVMKAWALTVVPLWLLLALLLRNHPILFIFCVWWLKPIYDRVPLLVVSRALFGAVPSVKEVVKSWPKLMIRRLWFALIVGRFSPSRSLTLPVAELEGLRGRAYHQRVNSLERNGGEGATMATLAGVILEAVTGLGMIMLVMMMVPDEVSTRWWSGVNDYFEYGDFTDLSDGFFWLISVVYMAAITLMEPFYVSAGFALYVNSRTLTEGWDIELAFKRLSARLAAAAASTSKVLMAMLCFGMSVSFMAPLAHAEDDVSCEQMQEVLADEDFTIHHRMVDVPVENDTDHPFLEWLADLFSGVGLPAFMGAFGLAFFYLILATAIAGFAYLIYRNRHVFENWGRGGTIHSRTKIKAVMGMDVRPESLPDNVQEAALLAWENGDHQLALSLLYRGAIMWIVHRGDISIQEGDTEGDCLARVQQLSDGSMIQYFSGLTQAWISVAYGKKTPADTVMSELCQSWPFHINKAEGREQ